MTHDPLRLILPAAAGIVLGIGAYTFHFAEGLSYFSTDPKACANCHIMTQEFNSWQMSSHHAAARCVDCHLPHTFVEKYIAKAENGYHHSVGFTFQNFHEPIMVKERNSRILQENCERCHAPLISDLAPGLHAGTRGLSCVHCHASVGHGERAGLGGPARDSEFGGRHE